MASSQFPSTIITMQYKIVVGCTVKAKKFIMAKFALREIIMFN
jgi:hypothetical protein